MISSDGKSNSILTHQIRGNTLAYKVQLESHPTANLRNCILISIDHQSIINFIC